MRIVLAVAVASFALSCSKQCSAENCDGCCDASGVCKQGSSNNACGSGGAECEACNFGQSCVANACFGNLNGGGNGSTGGGSGATGGGTGVTGGGGGSTGGGSGLPSGAWVKQFGASDYDIATDVTFDSAGNVYVLSGAMSDFSASPTVTGALRKFSSAGAELWNTPLFNISPTRLLADGSSIYVVGGSLSTGLGTYETFVGKYDTQSGGEQWSRTSISSATSETLSALVVDASGSLLASGATYTTTDAGTFGSTALMFVKYSASGTPTDSRVIDAGFNNALAMNADGRMLVMASNPLTGAPTSQVAQYRLGTGVDWSTSLSLPDGGGLYVVAGVFGGANQSFVTGYSSLGDGGTIGYVYELGATGNVVWQQTLSGSSTGRMVFDSASDTLWVSGTAQADVFTTSFVNGARQGTTLFGTTAIDAALGIAVNSTHLCTAGFTNGAFPGFTNAGSPDAGPLAAFDSFVACWPR